MFQRVFTFTSSFSIKVIIIEYKDRKLLTLKKSVFSKGKLSTWITQGSGFLDKSEDLGATQLKTQEQPRLPKVS